jgi:geranylgeranyl pyrophosphate synthase
MKRGLHDEVRQEMANRGDSNLIDPKHLKTSFQKSLASLDSLREVEGLIAEKLSSDSSVLESVSRYLFELGGKRIRPALCLLLGHAFIPNNSPQSQQLVQVAAGIELIHMATLLHDDIIDKSPLRRHKTSPYIQYGLPASLLAGDFLLTRAFRLCANLDDFIIEQTELACIELTEGEVSETPLYQESHSAQSSLEIARKKTASLFRLASVAAGHLSIIASDRQQQASLLIPLFERFGENLGVAFQILDDILDVAASEEELGKPAGIDIHERKPSIVNVLWLQSDDAFAAGLKSPAPAETDSKGMALETAFVQESIVRLRDSNVLQQCRHLAETYAKEAENALLEIASCLPKTNQTDFAISALQTIIQYALARSQ